MHFFSSQGDTWARYGGPDLIGRVAGLHDAMAAAGLAPDQFKPILIDEGSYTGPAGRWSGRGTSTADPADPFNRAQRDYVTKALARSAYTGAQGFLWFLLRDSGGGLGSDVAYGLRDATGSPKPSFHAYRYFSGLIDRGDRLVGALSPGSPKLEGYEFTATDGRQVQVVWNEADDEAAHGCRAEIGSDRARDVNRAAAHSEADTLTRIALEANRAGALREGHLAPSRMKCRQLHRAVNRNWKRTDARK